MAVSFDRGTAILDVGGIRLPPEGGRWVLWPAWCWRVLVPDPVESRLNTFTRVIARLWQAGVHEPDEMAALTRLHPDMCRQILEMLRQLHFIDRHRRLTVKGRDALAGKAWDTEKLRVVHVFQDPFGEATSRPLWPTLIEDLGYANVDYRRDGRPLLRVDYRRDSPSVMPLVPRVHDVPPPRPPSPRSIVRLAHQARSGAAAAPEEDPDGGSGSPSPVQISRVSLITAQPEPVLLVSYVHLPEDALTSADWEALDPFSGWPDAGLKEAMRARMSKDRALAALVAEIEGQLAPADATKRQEEYIRLRAEGAVRVERHLGAWIHEPEHREILKLFTEVEADLADARLLGAIGGRLRQTAVNNAVKILEYTFAAVSARYPLPPALVLQLDDPVLGDATSVKAQLEEARKALAITTPLPVGMQRQSGDQIARASVGHLPSFRPSVVVALLASVAHPGHPLRAALQLRPDLCQQLDEAAGLRNSGVHHQDTEPTPDEAEDILSLTYWTVSRLVTHPRTSEQASKEPDAPVLSTQPKQRAAEEGSGSGESPQGREEGPAPGEHRG